VPSTSEKQRKMMGADLARAREGKPTRTGMSVKQLEDFAAKPVKPTKGSKSSGKKR